MVGFNVLNSKGKILRGDIYQTHKKVNGKKLKTQPRL